jgi:putative methanogenesis marker protein 2
MNLDELVKEIRSHPGLTRKRLISEVINFFPNVSTGEVLASYGEDAAVLAYGDSVLLLAADGIMESLVKANPFFAGYYSVLVNINDISAMGGKPLAMVDVLSMKDEKVCGQVMKGIERAVSKFGVPVVGGHTHPDCNYNAIDIAILGTAERHAVIYSHTAKVNDNIIFAMDLDGYFPEKLDFAWDTTSKKDDELCRRQMLVMNEIGKKHLVHAGKDMSNPGSIGTLGMLLETSEKGGSIDIDYIPRPKGVDFVRFVKSYQGCGFVVTAKPEWSQSVIDIFESVGVTGSVVGKVDASTKLTLKKSDEERTLFDFSKEIITGCKPIQAGKNDCLRCAD